MQGAAVERWRIGEPILPSGGMGKVDDTDIDFTSFATTAGTLGNWADKEILAVRVAQNGLILFPIWSGTGTLKGLSSLTP